MRLNLIISGLPAVFFQLLFTTWLSAERTVFANHLSCVCSLAECENVSELDCPNGAGTVWDSCRCCRICARVENEPCGGPYGFSGSCAEGLECVVTDLFKKNGVGVCTRILNKEMSCESPKVISGCNIVDSTCRCEHAESCADDSPFNFKTHQECKMNLEAMLALKDQSADDDEDKIKKSHTTTSLLCLKKATRPQNDNRGVKIYIKNQHNNDGSVPPEIDEEQFEHLKDMYYKQCQPINTNLIRKLTGKHTATNYNYYDSAQCSRVIPTRIDTASHNVSSMARPSRRDIGVIVHPRDQKSSRTGSSGAAKKPDTTARNHSCAKCHRRHY